MAVATVVHISSGGLRSRQSRCPVLGGSSDEHDGGLGRTTCGGTQPGRIPSDALTQGGRRAVGCLGTPDEESLQDQSGHDVESRWDGSFMEDSDGSAVRRIGPAVRDHFGYTCISDSVLTQPDVRLLCPALRWHGRRPEV